MGSICDGHSSPVPGIMWVLVSPLAQLVGTCYFSDVFAVIFGFCAFTFLAPLKGCSAGRGV